MVKLSSQLNQFNPFKALVLGDFMLDSYTTGYVKRISPEAPVGILKVEKQTVQPGGAGNVVLNLIALGASVFCVGKVGNDEAGKTIKKKLEEAGADVSKIVEEEGFQTPIKNRLIAENQQILRVDIENTFFTISEEKDVFTQKFLLDGIDVVVISDYNKGSVTYKMTSSLIAEANKRKIPVVVDPKGEDFTKYQHATLIKPNLKEARMASKMPEHTSMDEVAQVLLKETKSEMLLITLSEMGMVFFEREKPSKNFPVQAKEVVDVTGAGDTVLAVISGCIANQIDMDHAITYANIAASFAIEKLGCVQVSLSELARGVLKVDVESKIFQEEHTFALKKALESSVFSVLALNSSEGFSTKLLQTIKNLSKKNDHVILYLLDENPNEEFIFFLSSLSEVDFIVLKNHNLMSLFEGLKPKEQIILEKKNILRNLNNFYDFSTT